MDKVLLSSLCNLQIKQLQQALAGETFGLQLMEVKELLQVYDIIPDKCIQEEVKYLAQLWTLTDEGKRAIRLKAKEIIGISPGDTTGRTMEILNVLSPVSLFLNSRFKFFLMVIYQIFRSSIELHQGSY
jgi:hypothetical protein